MKKNIPAIYFSFLLFFTYSIQLEGIVVVCEDPLQRNCIKYLKVSVDGITWRNACCSDFKLIPSQNCSDDCPNTGTLNTNSGKTTFSPFLYEGLKWNELDDKGSVINSYEIEFIGNIIYLNGEVLIELDPSIKAVFLTMPNDFEIGLKKSHEPSSGLDNNEKVFNEVSMLFESIRAATKERKRQLNELSIFPNPVKHAGEFQIRSPVEIKETTMISLKGELIFKDKVKWKGERTLKFTQNMSPGIYLLTFVTNRNDTITKKVIHIQKE